MKLSPKEFKRFKELEKLIKSKKASGEEQAEYNDLAAKKNETGSNDPKWWSNYPELVRGVTNLPFNYIPGTHYGIEGNQGGGPVPVHFGNIFRVNFIEAIGKSDSNADAFNTQTRQLWLDLHRKYRGIGTYEQADLGIAILAIRSVFNLLAKFERIYGVINTYQVGNRVVPNGLKDALGITVDIENNLADFRYMLNFYIEKLKQLCLPKGLSASYSDVTLLSNVFKDSEDRRACLFLFDSESYGIYDPAFLSTGGVVKYLVFQQTGTTPSGFPGFTVADIRTILDNTVNALLADDDISRICSDLLAAYGPENVETLVNIPESYYVIPVHDYERSLMFHNLTITGRTYGVYETSLVDVTTANNAVAAGITNIIYQHDNVVRNRLGVSPSAFNGYIAVPDSLNINYSVPTAASLHNQLARANEVIFDTWNENPTESDIMVGTRMTTLAESWVLSGGNYYQMLATWGLQVVTSIQSFVFDSSSNAYVSVSTMGSYLTGFGFNDLYISQCDWHPTFYMYHNPEIIFYGDIDNFTLLNITNLRRIHEVAILSGFKFSQVTNVK